MLEKVFTLPSPYLNFVPSMLIRFTEVLKSNFKMLTSGTMTAAEEEVKNEYNNTFNTKI